MNVQEARADLEAQRRARDAAAISHVEMLCLGCQGEWVSEAFEGELDRADCPECSGPGVRA